MTETEEETMAIKKEIMPKKFFVDMNNRKKESLMLTLPITKSLKKSMKSQSIKMESLKNNLRNNNFGLISKLATPKMPKKRKNKNT